TFAAPSPEGARPDRSVRIALLQGNIPQAVKWDEAYRLKTLEVYEKLTYKHAQGKPDLIVWPETAAPFFFLRDKAHRERVLNLSAKVRAPLLVGAVSVTLRNREHRLRNSAFLVTPEKRVDGQYHKTHLVPYGEYVPLKRFFPFIRKMVSGIGDFLPGDRRTVFPLAKAPFSVLICYEVIFADEVRRFVRNGARLLVNITNDAWFGRSAGPYQHMSIAALRAVENRVPLVRAANTGITGVVDATGKIREATTLFVPTGVLANVAPGTPGPAGLTFYTRHGDLFAYLSAALAVLILGLHWAAGRHSARKG
ncbi:MAG: apolipoprotein N-acyltransferase, partial [Nitrospinota bacterium]|nr:apolipoprotein N-acyltransferase [Nitrospinota bacterium]